MKKLLMMTAGLIFSAGAAMADVTADRLVAAYQAQGFTAIEVTTGPSQIKVEAIQNRIKIEAIYDIATGTLLKQEQDRVRMADGTQVVEVKATAKDFLKGRSGDDDANDDHGNSGDGADDGEGHDAGDDSGHGHSGNDNSGHDDNGHSGSSHDGGNDD